MSRDRNFSRLIGISTKGRRPLFLAIILSAVSGVFSVFPYYIAYMVVSSLYGMPVTGTPIPRLAIWLVAFIIIKAASGTASGLLAHYAAYNILYDIRINVIDKMAKLPVGYFTLQASGEIRKTLMEDVEKLEKFFAHHICDMVKIIVMPITTLILLLGVSIPMSIASVIPLILGLGFQYVVYKNYNTMMEEYYFHSARISTVVVEYIRGMPIVKAFNKTVQTFMKFNTVLSDYKKFWMKFVRKTGLSFTSFSVCSDAGFLFVLPLGMILVAAGMLSVPKLFLFLSVGVCYTLFIPLLSQVASTLSINMKNLDGVYEILDKTPLADPSEDVRAYPEGHSISIRNLSFGYQEDIPVLENISMEIPEGKITAFVGPSGSGKSTMANLIARFYDPWEGRILMGGADLRNIPYSDLMDNVAYVFQDNFSFSDTVLENIRMYRSDVGRDDVEAAARLAQAHDFITQLPGGYDTILGSRGTYLSGGQLQRLSIARAIIKDAPVVILDEATAFADPENENLIQRGLSVLLKGKTVVVIAHRLFTVRNVDRIYVFSDGGIAESGSFTELKKQGGLFKSLWETESASSDWKISTGGHKLCRE